MIDVKSSIINNGYTLPDDDITSTPDIEFMNNSNEDLYIMQEEEKMSSISKNSFIGLPHYV